MGKYIRLAGIALLSVVACVAITVPLAKQVRDAPQSGRDAQNLPGGADGGELRADGSGPRGDGGELQAGDGELQADGGSGTVEVYADPPGEPVPGVVASPEPSIYLEFFTRTLERKEIESRGAPRGKAGLEAATLHAAVTFNSERWGGDQRRELLAYLRGGSVDQDAAFTGADARIIARLQTGSGAEADGKLRDETMAVLFAAGFRFSARKAKVWEVKLEFYPGELEDREAWDLEIDEEISNGGSFRDVDAPEGEGSLYVYVGGRIVASYRGRGGPPSRIDDSGKHVAVPTTPGVYKLGVVHTHVTKSWYHAQIPWGAEIRKNDEGYQYRWPAFSGWSWATSHPAGTLAEPFQASDFEGLPEVTRDGETLWIWTKNDFGPLAWNLTPSDLYVHTTPDTEAAAARGAATTLTHSHGCIHIDPLERDEMMARGYLNMGVLFVVRKFDEHLLPDPVRRDMLTGTGVASKS